MINNSSIGCKLDTSVQVPVGTGNGGVIPSKGKGIIVVETTKVIEGVLPIPNLVETFLSVAQMINNGYSLLFENNHCVIFDYEKKQIAKVAVLNKRLSSNVEICFGKLK
ncbi:hypothetical protein RND81_06G010400 [Saponaria officinalis]|uniref:Uncharacterized protein n=1 Tax=Saponaria officinalis TaxID=3572 RepID=A0AAW1K8A3_SAPOF